MRNKLLTKNIIEFISIYGFLDKYRIYIPFYDNKKILIGENGIGKTLLLKIIFYILTRNFSKLVELPFALIEIKFTNSKNSLTIEKQKISNSASQTSLIETNLPYKALYIPGSIKIKVIKNIQNLNDVDEFKKVCNKYLTKKSIISVKENEIYIKSSDDKTIDFNQLSFGEQKIIAIFSWLYLSENNCRFIILFDEPELSLSIPWQKQILPDILASNKCDFLLATTHSPFIFDNILDRYAMVLSEYIL